MEASELQYADEYALHLLLGEGGQARLLYSYLVYILAVRIISYMLSRFTSPDSLSSRLSTFRLICSKNSTISISSIWWIVEGRGKLNWQIRRRR
jgi:hypothetical protein